MNKYEAALLRMAEERDKAQHQLDYVIKRITMNGGCDICPCIRDCVEKQFKPKYQRDCHAKIFNHSWKIAKRRME